MTARAVTFYLGVWVPTATCWLLVVLVAAAATQIVALWQSVVAALLVPMLGIALGALNVSEDKKGSWGSIVAHRDISSSDLFRLGIRKGLFLGPATVVGVAGFAALPFLLDRLLTALGK